ncbi:MAG: hypothetical protein ACP6IY_09735 [Promethearchaeia archaeon]
MAIRKPYNEEKKKPNLCISMSDELFMDYGVFCRNLNSSPSRELQIFIKSILKTKEIPKNLLEPQKTSKLNISIEKTLADEFKKLCRSHDNMITSVITKYIKQQMENNDE